MGTRGNIEKHHFIGTLIVIAECELHRVPDIAEFACLRFAKLDTPCYFSVVDIKTRDDTFCNHGNIKNGFGAQGKLFLANPAN